MKGSTGSLDGVALAWVARAFFYVAMMSRPLPCTMWAVAAHRREQKADASWTRRCQAGRWPSPWVACRDVRTHEL